MVDGPNSLQILQERKKKSDSEMLTGNLGNSRVPLINNTSNCQSTFDRFHVTGLLKLSQTAFYFNICNFITINVVTINTLITLNSHIL